jgi:hypothetical protein
MEWIVMSEAELTRYLTGDAWIAEKVPGGHEEPDRPPLRIRDSVQLGVHGTFGSSDLVRSPPFFDPQA